MRLIVLLLCVVPLQAKADQIGQALSGAWAGNGVVQLRPTSTSQKTRCQAKFVEGARFWLRGAVSCRRGKRTERVELRFTTPSSNGDLKMNIVNSDGETIVSLAGSMEEDAITLFHPETLKFSGEEYRPVLQFDTNDEHLRLRQIGVPTRSSATQYLMSDILFERLSQ